ncbi:uncharacterized protein K460DRAFT_272082 [Cucurbitaria berberidis CBS 394.84]|uniref:HMG box domain-containing protein n=1 Tax=Cucurbitaria berberidis CBS 394.84 TaxID=1168544 RepID=A0A9P4LEQ2_9PLEO|nr:uncharacterized protein K460DRAFT_272082 [Cucurbitaria berberidis CBS 394.84]KAF1851299.1 hypothetical protein K460DRAFT_272082 [Cucurbitaria berberidis CBS 394.84]
MLSPTKQLLALLPKSSSKSRQDAATPVQATSQRCSRAKTTSVLDHDANTCSYHQVIVALSNLQGGLTHVQNGLNDLLRAYMQHTASILAGEDGDLDKLQIPTTIAATASAAMEAATTAANGVTQVINTVNPVGTAATDGKSKKRKREKKEKDPNAPKKPLTAAFLYHQHARPVVRSDLEAALAPGQTLEKNAVQIEVNKRWNELPEEEKEQWKASYRNSMEEYKVELADYLAKNGAKVADIHEDEEASDEAEIEVDVGAIDSDASSEDEEEAPPVTKAPSPPAKTPRKRQKTTQTPAVNGASLPVHIAPATSSATPVPLPSSRTATQVPPPTSSAVAETPAKKDNKKKRAAPQPIAPAPAAAAAAASSQHEPSPEESGGGKKKGKSNRSTRNAEVEGDKENAVQERTAAGKKEKRDRSSKRKSEAAST